MADVSCMPKATVHEGCVWGCPEWHPPDPERLDFASHWPWEHNATRGFQDAATWRSRSRLILELRLTDFAASVLHSTPLSLLSSLHERESGPRLSPSQRDSGGANGTACMGVRCKLQSGRCDYYYCSLHFSKDPQSQTMRDRGGPQPRQPFLALLLLHRSSTLLPFLLLSVPSQRSPTGAPVDNSL